MAHVPLLPIFLIGVGQAQTFHLNKKKIENIVRPLAPANCTYSLI